MIRPFNRLNSYSSFKSLDSSDQYGSFGNSIIRSLSYLIFYNSIFSHCSFDHYGSFGLLVIRALGIRPFSNSAVIFILALSVTRPLFLQSAFQSIQSLSHSTIMDHSVFQSFDIQAIHFENSVILLFGQYGGCGWLRIFKKKVFL